MKAVDEVVDQALHVVASVVVLLPVALRPGSWWAYMVSALLIAVVREDAQHRKPDKTPEGWLWMLPFKMQVRGGFNPEGYPVDKTVGGWKRWIDIVVWAAAGLGLGVVVQIVR